MYKMSRKFMKIIFCKSLLQIHSDVTNMLKGVYNKAF